MIGAFVVIISHILLFMCDGIDVEYYYYACSASYSVVCAFAAYATILVDKSKILWTYAFVNLIAAIAHLAVNFTGGYDLLRGFLWHDIVNLRLIIRTLDAVIIMMGLGRAFVFISGLFHSYCSKRKGLSDSVV